MNRLEAHARFDRREDRSILPADAAVGGCDCWPAVATSAAELSGRLDECASDDDLDDAVRYFVTPLDIRAAAEGEAVRRLAGMRIVQQPKGRRLVSRPAAMRA